jgi:8-oxo-dGTP pyrophosphatase MutT (NUDIX family)
VLARPAATVILSRPAERGFEVLMVRRLASAAAFADVFVFPGGGVRSDDYDAGPDSGGFSPTEASLRLTERGGRPPAEVGLALAFFRAAIRELFEEAGILLARDADGYFPRMNDAPERWATYREALQADRTSLIDVLRAERLSPDDRQLVYFSHWVTPTGLPRRFDTRFFVGELPEGQIAAHCRVETTESIWISPRVALERAAAGSLPLVLPTRLHLRRLAAFASQADVMAFARSKSIVTVQPTMEPGVTLERIHAFDENAEW